MEAHAQGVEDAVDLITQTVWSEQRDRMREQLDHALRLLRERVERMRKLAEETRTK